MSRGGRMPRRRSRALLVLACCLVLTSAALLLRPGPPATAELPAPYSIWDSSVAPTAASAADERSVEVGLRFGVAEDGWISALRFYRSAENAGPHTGRLWDAAGRLLAIQPFPSSDAVGWHTVQLPTPVRVASGRYVVSYRAPHGRYAADRDYFRDGHVTQRALVAEAGVYTYGDGFPNETYRGANYYVDVLYRPGGVAPAPVDTARAGDQPVAADGLAEASVRLRPVDGGPDYYERFTRGLPVRDSYLPIAVWFESVLRSEDLRVDRARGLNTYLELTGDSDLALLERQGTQAILSWTSQSPAVAGALITDEADMWAGAGWGHWTGRYPGQGDVCRPKDAHCGFTMLRSLTSQLPERRMTYANYGKGVTFWLADADAAAFVNGFGDVVSADNYWFTDPNICGESEGGVLLEKGRALGEGECRRAANYGATVERVRGLVSPAGSKPVWAFVEVGHPFEQDDAPTITGPQIRAAVWSSLIHGARGVVYFNHSFGGRCLSQHLLRDSCGAAVHEEVAELNHQLAGLAPVLNAPFVDGLVDVPPGIDLAAKAHDGEIYLMAASTQAPRQVATLSLRCGATRAEVVGEGRSVPVRGGRLTDEFADGNAVHVYRLGGGDRCRLP